MSHSIYMIKCIIEKSNLHSRVGVWQQYGIYDTSRSQYSWGAFWTELNKKH